MRNIVRGMSRHYKPGEYEQNAEPLKKAVESLRKGEGQHQPAPASSVSEFKH